MGTETIPVAVKILGKELRVACKEGEQKALLAAAELLNNRMLEVKSSGKVIGADQVAVMAALNLTHELLQQKEDFGGVNTAVSKRVEAMQEKIEDSLQNLQQMEF